MDMSVLLIVILVIFGISVVCDEIAMRRAGASTFRIFAAMDDWLKSKGY